MTESQHDRFSSNLPFAALEYTGDPDNPDKGMAFHQALQDETDIKVITLLLAAKYDMRCVVLPALRRLTELIPKDIELYLEASSIAFVCGEDLLAKQYLEKASRIDPQDIRVMQEQLFQMYGQDQWKMKALCEEILEQHPDDEYALECLNRIQNDPEFVGMPFGSPMKTKWKKYFTP